jgi:hypothetical protein
MRRTYILILVLQGLLFATLAAQFTGVGPHNSKVFAGGGGGDRPGGTVR